MKKLICAKEVESLEKKGQKVMYIDCDTIITPSAKDAAAACGMEFSTQAPPCCEDPQPLQTQAQPCSNDGGIDSETIYKALQALMSKGMLNGILDGACDSGKPYAYESDSKGMFKLVRGSTAKMEVLDTGNPNDKVFYQELIGSDDKSSMNAGFMTIERSNFDWDVQCEEIYYIVEGTLTVTLDGRVFTANPGDALFIQNGSKLAFGSADKVKVFYATY